MRHRLPAALLTAALTLVLAVSGLLAGSSPARADIFGWYLCQDIPKVDVNLSSRKYVVRPFGSATGVYNSTDLQGSHKVGYTTAHEVETTTSVTGSVEATYVIKAVLEAGWAEKVIDKTTTLNEETYPVPPHTGLYAQPYVRYLMINYSRSGPSEMAYFGGAYWCKRSPDTTKAFATIPVFSWVCVFTGLPSQAKCPPHGRGEGGGGSAPGATPVPPTGPQPVTSVHGLADGTLLATTDTGRVYKMVGGAPIWQATCAEGICPTTPHPTTQAVIDAGPKTPRNGSTVIDQQGRVHLFVGGAPLWQETCDPPVNCGTPVKVSSWSVDARDHMNQSPSDGQLVQAKSGSTDLPVSVTVGGALIPFATPQEVVDAGYGQDWASRVVAISPGSYRSLGTIPADGTLVQGAGGGTSTPVAMILGGAAIPFANPQEVIDAGYGDNWTSKVRGIPSRHFHTLPPVPHDGLLIQGSQGTTPVAAIMGGARIDFANPQEVVDSGFGTDWGTRLRYIPARAFQSLPTKILDGTRIGKSGTTSEAAVVGGARIDFHSQEERNATGYGDRPLHVLPARVWDAMSTRIADGTRLQRSGTTSEAAVVGGARIDFHSEEERNATGYGNRPLQAVPPRVWDAMSTTIPDGTLVGRSGATAQGAVVGGAVVPFIHIEELQEAGYGTKPLQTVPARVWDGLPRQIADGTRLGKAGTTGEAAIVGGALIPFHSATERNETGYGTKPLQTVPARVWDGLPRQIADGTRLGKAGTTGEAAIVGGALIPFHSATERNETGYGTKPLQTVPARVWDGLPRQIADGTRLGKAGTTGEAAIVGGALIPFHSATERNETGYGTKPLQTVPARVWDGLPRQIADGTRLGKAGTTGEAAIVGGALIPFHSATERNETGYGTKPLQTVPARIWDGLPRQIADGTRLKAPAADAIWLLSGGQRLLTEDTGTVVWTVPQRVIDAIPQG
ncbi:hypothetical protein [Streptomyces sp. enrichment culture]|uniref:hypothetical protein n=1 Tax=Streptomyces sp. enrichment culture TaxID=1795815 RepID=UPI003F577FFA